MIVCVFCSYSDSDSESDEEWPGLTPPPPIRSAVANSNYSSSSNYNGKVGAFSQDFTSPSNRAALSGSKALGSTTSGAGGNSASRGYTAVAHTPNTAGSVQAAHALQCLPDSDEEETGVCKKVSRSVGRARRYIQSIYDTVRALLSIKTYRYLLGGEIFNLFVSLYSVQLSL